MTTKNHEAAVARAEYDEAVAHIRKHYLPSEPEYADAMSRACEEYEAKMRSAAASGDQAAKKTLKASKGRYLRSTKK
jgi:hypothetical protein